MPWCGVAHPVSLAVPGLLAVTSDLSSTPLGWQESQKAQALDLALILPEAQMEAICWLLFDVLLYFFNAINSEVAIPLT